MNTRRFPWPHLLLASALVSLSGCAAGLLGYLAYKNWDDWFKDENVEEYRVWVDGYDFGAAASASGTLALTGLTEGDYLVTVAKPPEMRRGVHATVHVQQGRSVDLSETNPFEGGVITGTVRREGPSGPAVANVRVVAIRDATTILSGGGGPIVIPQPAGTSLDYMMGYTDSQGKYRLGPAKYGAWLVTAVIAGYMADVKYTRVAAGTDGDAPLTLAPAPSSPTGLIRGIVSTRSGGGAHSPLLTARLGAPFEPPIDFATRSRVEADARLTMPAGPWFRWLTLTTIGSEAGEYYLDCPAGTHLVEALKTPWPAVQQQVTVTAGSITTQDFSLPGG